MEPIEPKVYYILKRFHSSFKLRRNPGYKNPNKLSNCVNDIYVIDIYKCKCIYTNNNHNIKDHLVIKYKYQNNPEIISLNIPWEKYNDLLTFKNIIDFHIHTAIYT